MSTSPLTRRTALRAAAGTLAAPFVWRAHAHAAPSDTLLHVSVGAGGRARADVEELTQGKHVKLVAAADVDAGAAASLKKKFPDIRVYADWREMFDKEKFDSVNVGTPDHTHAGPTLRALRMGKPVLTQKPLTQTLLEARQLALAAAGAKVPTQMGIQIHSAAEHKTVVAAVRAGAVGKVREVHSWNAKDWGDASPRPDRADPVPAGLDWDLWLGPAAAVPFLGSNYYHPGNWRRRLPFGGGTLGDMGCHILDPVYGALGLTAPTSVRSAAEAPNADNWAPDTEVRWAFPATAYTTAAPTVTWYSGHRRVPEAVTTLLGGRPVPGAGSVYVGTDGVLFSPYIGMPVVLLDGKETGHKLPVVPGTNHFLEWADAARGVGTPSAPFSYSGPLTEVVLLGCLATRFPGVTLDWNAAALKVTNVPAANQFVRRDYRKGWEEAGL